MKVRRYIAVLGLIGVCLIALAVARMPAAKSLIGTSQQDVKRIKEDPTPIQERVLTEKQNRHRKLFHHNGPKLRELADRNAGDVEIVEGSGHQIKVNGADSNPSVLQTAL
ncbi:MAG: hypothetical protein ACRD9R_00540 [Pyrinomonadaceae bacterium]